MSNEIESNELKKVELSKEYKQAITDYIKENHSYYITNIKSWVSFIEKCVNNKRDREWVTESAESYTANLRVMTGIEISHQEIKEIAFKEKNVRRSVTSSKIGNQLNNKLNKAEIENLYWIQNHKDFYATKGQKNEYIHTLIESICGGKSENIEHLYQWLTFKLFKAVDGGTLPAINIFGQGGTGKNLFFEHLLPTMFHGANAIVNTNMKSVGGFNSEFESATVLVFNESDHSRSNSEGMKNLIGSKFHTIEKKGYDKYQIENLLSFLLFTNDPFGSVQLDSQAAVNRRYSIIHAETRLEAVIKKKYPKKSNVEVKQYVENLVSTLTDESAVIGHVKWMEQTYSLDRAPNALHGADFLALKGQTRNVVEQVCDYLFSNETGLTAIPKTMLIDLCKQMHFESSGKKANEKSIRAFLEVYVKNNEFISKNVKIDGITARCIVNPETGKNIFDASIFRNTNLGFDNGFSKQLINSIRDYE